MHIEFSRLIIHNFMSFGDADLRFKDDGFIRVSGINENPLDNAGSNGSGKSSLWEAIVWAITGETIRGTKQIVNIYGTDGCFVEIEFYVDKTRYQIIRSKDHSIRKTSIQIIINGEDVSGKGVRDSEKLLQQYLPDITASLLGSVIILGQGLPQKFTNNTPSGRKEVLEKLSKSDFMIEDLKSRVSKRKTDLSCELRSVENLILEQNTQKTLFENQIDENKSLLESLDATRLNEQLESSQECLSLLQIELSVLRSDYDSLTDLAIKLKEEDAVCIAQQNTELCEHKTKYDVDTAPLTSSLNELKAKLHVETLELSRIRAITDICPTCGQRITSVHKPDTTDLEASISSLSDKIKTAESELDSYKKQYESVIKTIQDKYKQTKLECARKINENNLSISTVKSKIETKEIEIDKIQATLVDTQKQIAQLEATINNCNKIINDNLSKLSSISENILYNNKHRDITQQHLEVISKFDTSLKRDFRGYLLSTVISYIEARAKYYSKIIFDTENIHFCLDGNNIDISYMSRPYENLSGGEKQKIDLIIQFSIRDMLSNQLGFTSNILVLDEVFDGLDAVGCNKVIDMIASLSDIKNIFIVTHRKDLSIPSDKELTVVKSSVGITEIRE